MKFSLTNIGFEIAPSITLVLPTHGPSKHASHLVTSKSLDNFMSILHNFSKNLS